MPHPLPKLPYSFDALEPHIDAKTMEIHYSKHHQTYTDKLNAALEKHPELFEKSVEELLKNLNDVPEDIRTAVKNHGGGYVNHNIFWETLAKEAPKEPTGELFDILVSKFGSFDKFKEEFSTTALNLFGSGWAWLCIDTNKEVTIKTTQNQDSPLSEDLNPILALDVWEHAYYLKYQNKRADYIQAFWNVINWPLVSKKFED